MKPTKYTIRDVVILINRGHYGINELFENKERLKEIHLLLILELAAEYIGGGGLHDASFTACTGIGHEDR